MFAIDHIAVAAGTLEDGAAYVQDALGVSLSPGGKHRQMGTHNRLLRLGEDLFLEVITIDPDVPPPPRRRWFDLDGFGNAAPRIQTWIARTFDLDAGLAAGPSSAGKPCQVSRGDMHWRIAVPDDGSMAYGGAYPTLIQWPPGPHPAASMAEAGCALVALEIEHPQAAAIAKYLGPDFGDERLKISAGVQTRFRALIETPNGVRTLG